MKKKFSFVLAIILIVCTLSISLVACSPKDPEAFKAYDKNDTLTQIMDAWTDKNVSVTSDTLGMDINLSFKDEDTDIAIALKGGITKIAGNSDKEGLSLSVVNNKSLNADKSVLNVVICNSGLYFDVAGYTDKTIRISDFSLPLDMLKALSMDDLVDTIKTFLLTFIVDSVDEITIDPVMNGKNTYDVVYSFDIDVAKFIDSVVDLLSNFTDSINNSASSVVQIKEAVGDLKLSVVATTAGNKREKVAKPKKDQPKYTYTGGSLSDFKVSAIKDGNSLEIGNDIKLQGSLPELSIPTDFVEVEAALFPSNVNGTFVMKNSSGVEIGEFEYTANIDFDVTNLYTTFVQCLSQQNFAPLLNKMFINSNGKIFVEVTHTCGDKCTINHLEENSRPILTIAYDTENFGANRIYFAVNTRAIATADFGEKLLKYLPSGSTETANDILNMLPQDDLIFSVDPTAYIDVENAKNAFPTSINMLVSGIADSSVEKQVVDINQIVNMILSMDGIADNEQLIKDIVNFLLPDVSTIEISSERTQNAIVDNLKEKFVANRNFAEQALVGSKITFAEQFAGVVKITSDKVDNLYDNNDFRKLTIEEIKALVGAKVTANFKSLNNTQKSEEMIITDIIGLDKLDVNSTEKQSIYLVVGGALGNNLYDFTNSVSQIFGSEDTPKLAQIKDLKFIESVIKIDVTLA